MGVKGYLAMHLVINAMEVGRRRGGNESFITGLAEGLATLDSPIQVTLLTCDWGGPLDLPSVFQQVNLGRYRRLPFFLWQQTAALRRLSADWYLANFFLPLCMPCKGAVAVHDLSFRAHPEYFPWTVAWYMRWLTGLSVKRAHCVLTGSEFSRQELLHFYPVDKEKVVSVHYSVAAEFQPAADAVTTNVDQVTLTRYGVTPPYILALGNIHPRKNLARLLDAYLRLRQQDTDVPLMVWGGLERWGSGELLEHARDAGVIITGFVAQEDLPALYRQAMMLVYPSLYEGFGLPPLEAMACGTPVITSDRTSLPEVVGEAALLVDPTDVEAIAAAMARLIDNVPLRQHLREAGIERASELTWRHTAQRLLASLGNERLAC
jgi:glycosyltransferase involved in cell wall biosynthesis